MNAKRRVAQLVAPKKIEIIEEDLRPLKSNEILIRILSCGLCHSEMPTYLGKSGIGMRDDGSYFKDVDINYPIVIGHEPVGVIEDTGKEVKNYKIGDYVSGLIKPGFASYVVVDLNKPLMLIKLPSELTENVKYCLVEPLTCISNIVRAATPEYGDYVAVIGCGFMGLLSISSLARSGAFELVAIDLDDYRLEYKKKYGATKTVNPKKENTKEVINNLSKGHGIDVVIEITGRMAGFSLACDIIRGGGPRALANPQGRGKILISSLYGLPETMDAGYNLMFKSPIIHSVHPFYSLNYREDMKRAIEGYRRGLLPINELITHEFSLEDIDKGFKIMENPRDNFIKGIVIP